MVFTDPGPSAFSNEVSERFLFNFNRHMDLTLFKRIVKVCPGENVYNIDVFRVYIHNLLRSIVAFAWTCTTYLDIID